MLSATTTKAKVFKALRLTKRDLQVFVVATVMFSSLAAGAVTLTQPAHSQLAGVCSADKYFR